MYTYIINWAETKLIHNSINKHGFQEDLSNADDIELINSNTENVNIDTVNSPKSLTYCDELTNEPPDKERTGNNYMAPDEGLNINGK